MKKSIIIGIIILASTGVGVVFALPSMINDFDTYSQLPITVIMSEKTAMPGCEKTNECFVPTTVSINIDDTVTWENKDITFHNINSGTPETGYSRVFDSGLIASGESYSYTFDTEGVFNYYCSIHPWSTGQVIVK